MKPRLLVLDDDPVFNAAVDGLMSYMGFSVSTSTDVQSFLENVRSQSPDLVLVDLNLNAHFEDFNGLDGLAVIREVSKRKQIPIIVTTVEANREIVKKALHLGASDYLVKPIEPIVLLSKISQFKKTDELDEMKLTTLPQQLIGTPAQIDLEFELDQISETGITFLSKHLMSQGNTLFINGSFVSEVLNKKGPLEVKIERCEYDRQRELHRVYASFSEKDGKLRHVIRKRILETATRT